MWRLWFAHLLGRSCTATQVEALGSALNRLVTPCTCSARHWRTKLSPVVFHREPRTYVAKIRDERTFPKSMTLWQSEHIIRYCVISSGSIP